MKFNNQSLNALYQMLEVDCFFVFIFRKLLLLQEMVMFGLNNLVAYELWRLITSRRNTHLSTHCHSQLAACLHSSSYAAVQRARQPAPPGRTSPKCAQVKGVSKRLQHSFLGFSHTNRLLQAVWAGSRRFSQSAMGACVEVVSTRRWGAYLTVIFLFYWF